MGPEDIPDELVELERKAWAEIQAGALTVETAAAVQAGITDFARGGNRFEVEAMLKKLVRHSDEAA